MAHILQVAISCFFPPKSLSTFFLFCLSMSDVSFVLSALKDAGKLHSYRTLCLHLRLPFSFVSSISRPFTYYLSPVKLLLAIPDHSFWSFASWGLSQCYSSAVLSKYSQLPLRALSNYKDMPFLTTPSPIFSLWSLRNQQTERILAISRGLDSVTL